MSEFYPQDDDAAFWEDPGGFEAQQAEADSSVETPAEEVVAEEAPAEADTVEGEAKDGRPRDEQGRFIKQEEPEAAVVAEADPVQSELESLKKRLADKDEFNGRLTNELGALRQQLAGIEQQVSRPQAPSSWDDLIEENPAQAVQIAYKNGDEYQLRRAAQAWEEVSPGAPGVWAENVRLRAEMEEKFAALEQKTQPVVAQSEEQSRARAYLNVKTKFPDIEQSIEQMQQVSTRFPALVTAIETGSQEEREQGWEALYLLTKAGATDTLRETAQQVARNALEGEQRVRQEAAVASAATVKTEAPKKTAADLIGEEWDALEKPLLDGWNIS